MPDGYTMNRIDKAARWYKSLAVILLNVVVLFAVLNLIALVVLEIDEELEPSNPVEEKYSYDDALKVAYTWLDKEQMDELLRETWSRPVIYEAFTQFKERPYEGKYVNVTENGFRVGKNQGPWPPESEKFNIFVFGGSTAFGYGVADDETVASYLQEELAERINPNVRVYNFARGYYFSTQERFLFEQLLAAGFVPDAAIFIDGMNEFVFGDGSPAFTGRLTKFMEGGEKKKKTRWYDKLPLVELIAWIQTEEPQSPVDKQKPAEGDERATYGTTPYLERVLERYLVNKRMIETIAAEYGVIPVFVWQPVPTYKYDLSHHVFVKTSPTPFGGHLYSRYGYELLDQRRDTLPLGDNFLWCADIQEDANKLLYVDLVHYSPELNHALADTIASLTAERKLLTKH